jgi:hypothetical protein
VAEAAGSPSPGSSSEETVAGAPTGPAEFPPTCVSTIVDDDEQQVITENRCDSPVTVKILIAFGRDSSCRTIPSNRSDFFSYNLSGRFDGIVLCG